MAHHTISANGMCAQKVRIAMCVSMDLLLALQFMHEKRVIHRDFKPSNVLLCVKKTVTLPPPPSPTAIPSRPQLTPQRSISVLFCTYDLGELQICARRNAHMILANCTYDIGELHLAQTNASGETVPGTVVLKVCDFGLSSELSRPSEVLSDWKGTWSFYAPERFGHVAPPHFNPKDLKSFVCAKARSVQCTEISAIHRDHMCNSPRSHVQFAQITCAVRRDHMCYMCNSPRLDVEAAKALGTIFHAHLQGDVWALGVFVKMLFDGSGAFPYQW